MPVEIRTGSTHRARFAPPRLSTAWSTVVSHLVSPSHPSTTSGSAIDSSFNHTGLYYNESLNIPIQHLDLLNPKSGTNGRHKRLGLRRKGAKSSQANTISRFGDDDNNDVHPNEPVSHVVVDADFDHFTPGTAKSDSGSTTLTPGASAANASRRRSASSGNDLVLAKVEGEDDDEEGTHRDRSEAQSVSRDRRSTWLQRTAAYQWLVEWCWPNIKHFMDSSFPEPSKEHSFQKEVSD